MNEGLYFIEFYIKDDGDGGKQIEKKSQILPDEDDYFELIQIGHGNHFIICKPKDAPSDDPTSYKILKLNNSFGRYCLTVMNFDFYYKPGIKNLKKCYTTMTFLNNYNSVTSYRYPHMDHNRKEANFDFNFPIEDYVVISTNQVLACSKQGWLSIRQQKLMGKECITVSEFQIDIDENEIITKLSYFDSQDILVIAASNKNKTRATKLLIYEVISTSDIVTLIQQYSFDLSIKDREIDPVIDISFEMRVNFSKTLLLLFTRDKLCVISIEDKNYWITLENNINLGGVYKDHILHRSDQIWVLLENDIILISKEFLLKDEKVDDDDDFERNSDRDYEPEDHDYDGEEYGDGGDSDPLDKVDRDEHVKKINEAYNFNKAKEELEKKIRMEKEQEEEDRDTDDIGAYVDSEDDQTESSGEEEDAEEKAEI